MLCWKALLYIGSAAAWTVENGAVAVTGSGDVVDQVPLEKLDGPVELFTGRSLDIGFKILGSPLPHQIAVRLGFSDESEDRQSDAAERIAFAKMRGNSAKVVVPFKSIPSVMLNQPLKATLLLSGNSGTATSKELFDLFVHAEHNSVPTSRAVRSSPTLQRQPDIEYTFPAPPRQVSPFFAVVFIAAIDVLFAALLMAWNSTLKVDPSLAVNNVFRIASLAVILCIELAFVGYYVSWSIFRLLSATAVLLPLLYLTVSRT